MIHAKNGTEVLENLQPVKSPGTGIEHWGASYLGPRYSDEDAFEVKAGRNGLEALVMPFPRDDE